MKNKFFQLLQPLLAIFILVSCNEEDANTFTRENGFISPLIEITSSFIHSYMLYDEYLRHPQYGISDTVSIYPAIFGIGSGDTIIIEFGPGGVGTFDTDGLRRTGKIRVIRNGDYATQGSITSFEYFDFFRNRRILIGSFELENIGINSQMQTQFRVRLDSLTGISDQSVLYSETGLITWLDNFELNTPKGSRKWSWQDSLMTYYNASNNTLCDVKFINDNALVYDETCDFRMDEGLCIVESDRAISGSTYFEVDMIGESACTNVIRVFAEVKNGFFFISKIGF
jgi:hypothetical protein